RLAPALRGAFGRLALALRPSGRRGPHCRLPLLAHEPRPEHAFRLELVVRPAAQPDPLHRRLTPARDRIDVVEFQPAPCRTALPGLAHEAALAFVPLPHRALDRRRDVAWIGR